TADLDLGRADRALPELAALCDDHPLDEPLHALALWRGPALADLPDRAPAAAGVEARRLDARRGRLTADLDLGRADRALPELAALCDDHPLDEPLHALRIRALRDTGRTAEALAAYEHVRRTIAARLGADPSPELRTLHTELLNQGAHEPDPDHPHPPPLPLPATPPGPGRTPFPHPPRPGNLRARLTSFVGRETDLATLRQDLSATRLTTLLGPGGAGKTRLSQETADAMADAWPDGVWLAELAPVDDPRTVPEAVLTTLGGRETVMRGSTAEGLRAATDPLAGDPLHRLAERCAQRRMLLVLDNCEHVIGAAAELAEYVLGHCPGVTVLATSREPLGVPGERVRPVEPLPDPVALRLLADRGAAARPGFRTDEDPEACAEICRRLDGLPLAIELAAARLRLLTPRQLADRLDDRFRLLTSGSRTVLPRQQTLRAVVDWSWDLLTAPERAVLRRLSVFAGGCDLGAAEAVCGDPPPAAPVAIDPRDVAPLLGSLVDKSLVVADPAADGEMRYRLLETVGEYAAGRLAEAGERERAERRHLVHFRELARTTDPLLRGPAQRTWLARLEREHDNLRAALRRAVAARDEQEALCLVLSLSWFWQLRDHRPDIRMWSKAVTELGPDPFAEPATLAPDLLAAATDTPPPLPPDLLGEARRGVRLIALVHIEQPWQDLETPEMQAQLRGIRATYRAGQPQTCRMPGAMWFFAVLLTGDADLLAETIDATVEGARRLGYEWELAYTLQFRARMLSERPGRAESARRDADESVERFSRLGDGWGVAEALSSRGEALERRGEYAAAAEDYREAIPYARELGAMGQVSLLRGRLAVALIESGDIEAGEPLLRESLAEGERLGGDATAFARVNLVVLLGRTGRTDEGRRQVQRLFEEEFGGRAPGLFAGMLTGLNAWLDAADGRGQDALEKFRTALGLLRDPFTDMVAPAQPVTQLMGAARAYGILGGAGNAERAARLLGAYDALLPAAYHPVAAEREARAAAEAEVRRALDDAAYERVYAEGGGLSLDEAAALV
ncbi:BTAD domain-containing putative transcriptional regulator, partial [Streptomyces pathocidini]|uniref:ATP-binding protein n=1 Tax=Streptomyces pathocidini TaxID=1650571 RepID=UPI00340716DC